MKRLLLIPLFAAVLTASCLPAVAASSTLPALRPREVPRGFHQIDAWNESGTQWARDENVRIQDVQALGLLRVMGTGFKRNTKRGLWQIRSLIRVLRGHQGGEAGLQFELQFEREMRNWPEYQDYVSRDRTWFMDAYVCDCDGPDAYRVFLWQYKKSYVVGTEMSYLSGPVDMRATLKQLVHYNALVLKRIP